MDIDIAMKASSLLKSLVAVDTCQPEGNERKLVEYILQRYDGKAKSYVIDHTPERASLVLEFKGADSTRCVAFAGHLDTVSCDLSVWSSDPFVCTEKDGKTYGRGTADMKGGVTAMLFTADAIASGELVPFCDVLFCFTADEEAGGMGAAAMCGHEALKRADSMFICEPSDKGIGTAEKGALWLRVNAKGRSSHGSRPDLGVNAAEMVIGFWQRFSDACEKQKDELLGTSSVCLTMLNAGTLTNVVPDEAFAEIDIRTVPGQSHDDIIKLAGKISDEIKSCFADGKIEVIVLNNRPAVGISKDSSFALSVLEAANELPIETYFRGLNFYTDASQLVPALGVPFVILGPGDDKLAHTTDEYVIVDDIVRCCEWYKSYLSKPRKV